MSKLVVENSTTVGWHIFVNKLQKIIFKRRSTGTILRCVKNTKKIKIMNIMVLLLKRVFFDVQIQFLIYIQLILFLIAKRPAKKVEKKSEIYIPLAIDSSKHVLYTLTRSVSQECCNYTTVTTLKPIIMIRKDTPDESAMGTSPLL